MKEFLTIISFFILLGSVATAQKDSTVVSKIKKIRKDSVIIYQSKSESPSDINMSYGSKGWVMEFDKKFMMRIQWRLQFRYESQSKTPLFFIPEEDDINGGFNVQRARLKVGGYAFQPYINYYLEYDFPSGYLLNWEFTFKKRKYLQFKLGQWKIKYNIERYISSGKQEFVDRSSANRYFTFDRQIGVLVQGDLFDGKIASSSYNLGVFNGNGRMAQNDDGNFLFFGRYQWNFSRKPMKLFFCDLDRVQKPEGFIAFAYARNRSAYTSFSSRGGGELPGYEPGDEDQYLVNQYNVEMMFKYRGFSFSTENHIKNIDDNVQKLKTQLFGGYYMAGYFFNEIVKFIPKPLELMVRYSYISNNVLFNENVNEYSIGLNWFFYGHRSKITTDFAYIQNQDFLSEEDNYRFRIQWDVSF